MATRNIVPRATGEGSIGTSSKTWGAVYANDVAVTNGVNAGSGSFTGNVTAATPSPGDTSTKLATTEFVQEELRRHGNIPIGHEYFQMNPNVPQGSLPLFGGEYDRETYSDLWAWVQTQTGYLITESAWTTMSNSRNGNVPFYSEGDGSTTFRVPSLKCWIKGANGTINEVGSYLEAGLPNITGSFSAGSGGWGSFSTARGAFQASNAFNGTETGVSGYSNYKQIDLNASNSNNIYGRSTTVQPESIVGIWLVKAYGSIVDTGTINEQAYINDRFNASKQYTNDKVSENVPTGVVQAFAGNTTPQGWLLCNGAAVSRTMYSALFAVIGTTYGSGNGTTTFNLPNLTDRFIQGNNTAGTVKSAGLPNITGSFSDVLGGGSVAASGALSMTKSAAQFNATSGNHSYGWFQFDASSSNSIYGNSSTVQPPALTMRYIIKI